MGAVRFTIPAGELREEFIRASGPGGQNVNKVSTAVRLAWHVPDSQVLRDEERERILTRLAGRISREGVLAVLCQLHRTREANREAALLRLYRLLEEALTVPRHRSPTKPGPGAVRRRLELKKHRAACKQARRGDFND